MIKKHLFLVLAVTIVGLMIVIAGVKVMLGGAHGPGGGGGGGGFAAAGPGGGGGGPGGPGGPGGGGGGGGRGRGIAVTATAPVMRNFVDKIEVLGAAKARQSINVTAATTQLISKIRFQSGEHVRAGQVLAELIATQQDAAIAQADSQAAYAKSTWNRWQQLADRGIAPAATAEQYKAAYDQAVANVNAQKAVLADRVIRAPFAGTVGLSDAAPGMLVNQGAVIATLDDLSVVKVDFPVPERFIPLLKVGLPIKATADAYPAATFQGRIAQVDTRLDPTSRSVNARAEFNNDDGRLKAGMLLHVSIDQAVRENPAVPEASVVFENGEAYVLLLQPAPGGQGGQGGRGQGGQGDGQRPPGGDRPGGGGQGGGSGGAGPRQNLIAVRHVIGTGLRQGGWVEVTSGLEPGQRIVADGTNRVRPNDPVQVAGFSAGDGDAAQPGGPQNNPQNRPQGAGAPRGLASGAGGRGASPSSLFAAADTDHDGVVTQAEWTASGSPAGFFARLDANGDGKITRTEMQAFASRGAAAAPAGEG